MRTFIRFESQQMRGAVSRPVHQGAPDVTSQSLQEEGGGGDFIPPTVKDDTEFTASITSVKHRKPVARRRPPVAPKPTPPPAQNQFNRDIRKGFNHFA